MVNIFLRLGFRAAQAYLRMVSKKNLKGSSKLAVKAFARRHNTQPMVVKKMAQDRVRFGRLQQKDLELHKSIGLATGTRSRFTPSNFSHKTRKFIYFTF